MADYDFDEDNGIIRDKLTWERCFIVSVTRAQDIFRRLAEIFKSGIDVLLLEASRSAGKHIVDVTRKDTKTDVNLVLSEYAKKFAHVGFGRIEVCELEPRKAKIRFRVWNNVFAEIRDGESTYCKYVEGLVSGVYERLLHKTPKVRELKCIGKGDSYCEFLLTPKVP